MERLQGLLGILLILGIALLASNNRRRIDWRLVWTGIGLQAAIALLIFKVGPIGAFFEWVGRGMGKIEEFARRGAEFVYGGIAVLPPGAPAVDIMTSRKDRRAGADFERAAF